MSKLHSHNKQLSLLQLAVKQVEAQLMDILKELSILFLETDLLTVFYLFTFFNRNHKNY